MHKKESYKWIICISCFLFFSIGMGFTANLFTIYLPYIIRAGGFTNTQGAFLITVRLVTAAISVMFIHRACGRIGIKACVVTGLFCEIVSRLLFAFADRYAIHIAASAFAGLAYTLTGMVPMAMLIHRWFQEKRGLALGIASTGSGVAVIVFSAPLTWLIERWGLRTAFLADMMLTAVIMAACLVLIRDTPEASETEYDNGKGAVREAADMPVTERKKKPSVLFERFRSITGAERLILLATCMMTGAPGAPGVTILSPMFTLEGFRPEQVAFLISFFGAVLTAGKFLTGALYDRIGSCRTNVLVISSLTLACVLSGFLHRVRMSDAIVFLILFGFGQTVITISMSIWVSDLEDAARYENTYSRCSAAYSVGALITSPLPGIIADTTGSYLPVYYFYALLGVCVLAVITVLYRRLG